MMSMVLRPTEPVEPRMVTRRGCRRGLEGLSHHHVSTLPPAHSIYDQHRHRHGQQAVDAVEHAAMAGDDLAGVLDPKMPLKC